MTPSLEPVTGVSGQLAPRRVVFTAGIGENAAAIRERVCRDAAWLGVRFDPAANLHHGPRISTAASPVAAWVIATDEERMIAQHTYDTLRRD